MSAGSVTAASLVDLGPRPASRAEREAAGRAARERLHRGDLARLETTGRPDPVDVLVEQGRIRVADLLPLRYGRMVASPFAFLRGSALVMASDLAASPHSGLTAQLCGDAHVANFGFFGTPERRLLFDLNDFDETMQGPFEWDLKRFLASLEVVARHIEADDRTRRTIVVDAAAAYRKTMREFAGQGDLDVWYARVDADQRLDDLERETSRKAVRRTREAVEKARRRDRLSSLAKLTTVVDGVRRFLPDPPLVVTTDDLFGPDVAARFIAGMGDLVTSYRQTLQPDRWHLLAQYRVVDIARKVVGVGSVGTRSWILLMQGADADDALILQAKEAGPSVLEGFVDAPAPAHHGQRVVEGQRLMQAASDALLGWQRSPGVDGVERDYYLRQLRDWKGALTADTMVPEGLRLYGEVCAWTLARAHARSGDRIAIAAYLGGSDRADQAFADFAAAYADLTASDHAALRRAVDSGRLPAVTDV